MVAAYAVLLGTLLLTGLAWYYVHQTVTVQERARFDETVRTTQLEIDRRMAAYIDAMRDARALFAVDNAIGRDQWHAFIKTSEIERQYPGIQAIAYAARVDAAYKNASVTEVPSSPLPADRTTRESFPLVYIEPSSRRNQRLLGFDMAAEQEYYDAMEQARDTGLPRASGKVDLMEHVDASQQAGFVICLPVYRNGQPLESMATRRNALQGFIVTVFRADDLLQGIFGREVDPTIDFEVFDGTPLTRDRLLHDDDGALHIVDPAYHPYLSHLTTLPVAGRTWSLYFTTRPNFEREIQIKLPLLMLFGGVVLSLVLFASTWLLATSRAVAVRTRTDLEAVNNELEAFSYSVSHDLRAPLRSINGFSQALLEDYGDKLDADGQGYLARIRAASQRMGTLIDNLLDLSRLSRSPLRWEQVNLSDLVRTIAEELQSAEPGRQVEFSIAEGVLAHGDASLLCVVLENLLGNAWKFTAKQPRAHIEFGAREEQGQAVYFVRDDGAGFDMAYADKLFGAFQRLHRADQFAGTGIGLATVQRIVHRHGGRVWAEGAVDHGATFFFTLSGGK
jgi:signal transduction histidine kinase